MPLCTKKHIRKHGSSVEVVPCYYIAGVCIVDPIHQGPLEMFLRSTYPYYHGSTYEQSKKQQRTIFPDNIKIATFNDELDLVLKDLIRLTA